MNVRETYALLIRIDRIFDAVACTWTGEAKGYRAELVAWSNAHDGSITPDLWPLKDAIDRASDRSEPWDRRCQLLSAHSSLVGQRLCALMGWSEATR